MATIRSLVLGLIATAALTITAGNARADGRPCNGPFCNQPAYPKYRTLVSCVWSNHSSHAPLPAFQAAPWYLYWPYDAHFLTPAPVTGAFYGPPNPGNFPVNPYFPGPAYGYGYAPIPGGPPPHP